MSKTAPLMLKPVMTVVIPALMLAACGRTEPAKNMDDITLNSPDAVAALPADKAAEADGLNLIEVAAGNPDFSKLTEAITATDVKEALAGKGPYTLFAPVDAAFDKMGQERTDSLFDTENGGVLTALLKAHVVEGKLTLADLKKLIADGGGTATLKTLAGTSITATLDQDVIRLSGPGGSVSPVTMKDVAAANGVIHAVDSVLAETPELGAATAKASPTPASTPSAGASPAAAAKQSVR